MASRSRATGRSSMGLVAIIKDHMEKGPYHLLWLMLHNSGRHAPSPAESRRKMSAAWEEHLKSRPATEQS